MSFIGSATYHLSKCLKCILSPLVGKTNFTTKNSTEFVRGIKDFSISNSQKQVSFDVITLFTTIPLDLAKQIVFDRLSSDSHLQDRTTLSVPELMKALDICFSSTSFTFQQTIYQQIFGTPMGSPLSPIIANMVMEKLEERANNSFHSPPCIWFRYVDDVYGIMESNYMEESHQYLNTIRDSIKFTREEVNMKVLLLFWMC